LELIKVAGGRSQARRIILADALISVNDRMPKKWDVVTIRCDDLEGGRIELKAYWTGQFWRVVGEKGGSQGISVTSWTD